MKINFYHLTTSPVGKALPKLLEKVIATKANVVVQAASDEAVEQLNKDLWTYTTKFFLPHGSAKDGFKDQQPIFLTAANENPNGATIIAIVGNAEIGELDIYDKCLYMFDGSDDTQVKAARGRWKEFKDAGHETIYWQQNEKGGWENKSA